MNEVTLEKLLIQEIELFALRAEMEGMIAFNQYRLARNETIAYDEKAFIEHAERIRALKMIESQ